MNGTATRFVDEVKARLRNRPRVEFAVGDLILRMQAGNLNQARQAAKVANRAVECNPEILLKLSIDGVSHDSREIDQIPTSRATLCEMAEYLTPDAFWRFELETQAIFLVAGGYGQRVGTQLEIWPPYVDLLRQR